MTERLTVTQANALPVDGFVAAFGSIAEASPWVATAAAAQRPFRDREALTAAFASVIDDAGGERQLALLRAHPDLAGRAAVAGDILPESRKEQAGAGLDRLSPEEFARFTELNRRYRKRFDFPFILAVRGASKDAILAAFEQRIGHGPEQELVTALEQVKRIIRFRLEDRVTD